MRTVIIFCLCLSAFAAQAQNDVNYTYMDSLFQQLPEVLVKGERPVVKAERGKLVYDLPRMVERLPVNNAYEAVKELPGIVEQDGNLTLGGRSITLVVNGKVSTLDKDDLKSVLQNTPVSRLEKAEIMYAAPARYRIRGAMVNVVLKSNIGQKLLGPVKWRLCMNSPAGRHCRPWKFALHFPALFGGCDVFIRVQTYHFRIGQTVMAHYGGGRTRVGFENRG